MINTLKKGLKAGDFFEDGGRVFVIDEVYPNGRYKSHVVKSETAVEVKNEAAEETAELETASEVDDSEETLDSKYKENELKKLTREELVAIATEEGKDSKGLKKIEIIALLLN